MPVLQGWTPAEYVTCAEWLPLFDWPELIGIGSVCRRQVHGGAGILAILEAVDAILPKHVRVHLFGVKSTVFDLIAHHPRVASVDSMAWDVQARAERRTGRNMDFRIGHLAILHFSAVALAAILPRGWIEACCPPRHTRTGRSSPCLHLRDP
ncbi:MAG: hypothetical protein C0607_02810 [Azoarcus sp.]|nr:MAG: hypothetical protein C0607_02810 [Azoarcus sp.]TVT57569.1 MAG: hypothetical protein FHK80_08645 [Azoarcus sp. PHD]